MKRPRLLLVVLIIVSALGSAVFVAGLIKGSGWRVLLSRDLNELNQALSAIREYNDRKYPAYDYALPKPKRGFLNYGDFKKLQDALLTELGIFYQDTVLGASAASKEIRRAKTFALELKTNQQAEFRLPAASIKPVSFSLENGSGALITGCYPVINNRDWHSLKAILGSIIGPSFSDKDKAISLWRFVKDNSLHAAPAHRQEDILLHEPVAYFNIFGYGICDDAAKNFMVMCRQSGLKARVWGLGGHTTAEVYYDRDWHMFDADQGVFYLDFDSHTIASVDKISRYPRELIGRNAGTGQERFIKNYGTRGNNRLERFCRSAVADNFEIKFNLRPKEKITFFYEKMGPWYTHYSWKEPPNHGIMVDSINLLDQDTFMAVESNKISYLAGRDGNFLQAEGENAFLVWDFVLPYPILDINISAVFNKIKDSGYKFYFSRDAKQWQQVKQKNEGGVCFSLRRLLGNFYCEPDFKCYLKLTLAKGCTVKALKAKAYGQLSPLSLAPFLSGKNLIRVHSDQEAKIRFSLTYSQE